MAPLDLCPLCHSSQVMDFSTTSIEHVECQGCGLILKSQDAIDRWNYRPSPLPETVILSIYERVAAAHAHDLDEKGAALDFGKQVAAAVVPDETMEILSVGVGLVVHGTPQAVASLRAMLPAEENGQVPDALALIQRAEQAGFTFDGQRYVATLGAIKKLVEGKS